MHSWKKLFILLLSTFAISTYADTATQKPPKLKVYLSASLFNERETRFNLELAKNLEQSGYDVVLPQRDGFVYKALISELNKKLSPDAAWLTAVNTIYFLNLGKLIPDSDVVIANLDQPIDEGVVVELTYAHLMGKPVIGIRTDLRHPYSEKDVFKGVHSFVAYQCSNIVYQHDEIRNEKDLNESMKKLTTAITANFAGIQPGQASQLPSYALNNPNIADIAQAANILFSGITDIHSQQGMSEVVKRFIDNKSKLSSLKLGVKLS